MSIGSNTIASADLMAFVERIERLEAEKSEIVDDIRAVYAEAKATGFVPKYIRKIVKRRAEKPADVQEDEALTDIYLNAAGLAKETPLFRHVGAMAVDRNARDQVIGALKALCPDGGEIVVKIAGQGVRLWRDKDGDVQAEDVVERPATPASPETAESRREAARKAKEPPPDVDDAGAHELGREAAKSNAPIISNPFPWNDARRAHWDRGWRAEAGSDGMGPKDPGGRK